MTVDEAVEEERRRLHARLAELDDQYAPPKPVKDIYEVTQRRSRAIMLTFAVGAALLVAWLVSSKGGAHQQASPSTSDATPTVDAARPAETTPPSTMQVVDPPSAAEHAAFRAEYRQLSSIPIQCERDWRVLTGIFDGETARLSTSDVVVIIQDCATATDRIRKFRFTEGVGDNKAQILDLTVSNYWPQYALREKVAQNILSLIGSGLSAEMIEARTGDDMAKLAQMESHWSDEFTNTTDQLGYSPDVLAVNQGGSPDGSSPAPIR